MRRDERWLFIWTFCLAKRFGCLEERRGVAAMLEHRDHDDSVAYGYGVIDRAI